MREILFKAKRADNGEWIEGALVQIDDSEDFYYIMPRYNLASSLSPLALVQICAKKIIPETLCEYTNLRDKNSNRIWENDIVNIEYPETTVKKCVIEYVGASFVGSTNADNWELDGYYDIEVIGNIFDDRELLTAERIGKNGN